MKKGYEKPELIEYEDLKNLTAGQNDSPVEPVEPVGPA